MSRWFWRGLGRGAISAKKICYATFRIIDLGRNYRQIFEFKWFIVKILINNDLGYSWMFPPPGQSLLQKEHRAGVRSGVRNLLLIGLVYQFDPPHTAKIPDFISLTVSWIYGENRRNGGLTGFRAPSVILVNVETTDSRYPCPVS
jgi:hypothetical protein